MGTGPRGGGFPGQAPIFALPEDLASVQLSLGVLPARSQPGPIIGRSGRDPISLEGLAQEKPNPRVSNPVEGGMSQPEGLDT